MKKEKKIYNISILPGDGIGPEVMQETYKIIDLINKKTQYKIKYKEFYVGGSAIDKYGTALPNSTLQGCKESDAILFGSVGGKKWENLPTHEQPERAALLPLRKLFNLFANIRPIKLYKELIYLSPLKKENIKNGFDMICVRELTGGIYFGIPKGNKINKKNEKYAFDTEIYYEYEIERIAHIAFKLAEKRKFLVTSVDKANVLESSVLWRKTVEKVSKKYPQVKLEHLYVDNAAMQLINNPRKFDILLCSNLFGDILSDECAFLSGSLGMLPSASLNNKNFGLYEPAGGSAPDIQGKKIANPIAQILSLALLLEYSCKNTFLSKSIFLAVLETLKSGYRTYDLSKKNFIKTNQMGNIIKEKLYEIL